MITPNTVKKLIENYDTIIQISAEHGHENLRFYYTVKEDNDTLCLLSTYKKSDEKFLFSNLNEKLSEILLCPVLITTDDSMSITDYIIREAENSPLSDRRKTVNYFFDVLIPASLEQENNTELEKEREKMLEELCSSKISGDASPTSKGNFSPNSASFFSSELENLIRVVTDPNFYRLLHTAPKEVQIKFEEQFEKYQVLSHQDKKRFVQ